MPPVLPISSMIPIQRECPPTFLYYSFWKVASKRISLPTVLAFNSRDAESLALLDTFPPTGVLPFPADQFRGDVDLHLVDDALPTRQSSRGAALQEDAVRCCALENYQRRQIGPRHPGRYSQSSMPAASESGRLYCGPPILSLR